jgi:hypothetical protein
MGRFVVLFALAGLIVTAPTLAQARGGPLHLYGPFSTPAEAADHTGFPTPYQPPNDFLAGCGHGRYRDPATHRCRGPADVR